MSESRISREELVQEARGLLSSLGDGSMSATPYDTAWAARTHIPDIPDEPLFPAAYDWLLRNQHADGSWGSEIPFAHDRVMSTMAALVALASSSYRLEASSLASRRALVYLNTARLDV